MKQSFTPPQDVRVQLRDGTEVPVELTYTGRDEAGLAVWTVANATFDFGQVAGITCDVLPGRTTISLPIRPLSVTER